MGMQSRNNHLQLAASAMARLGSPDEYLTPLVSDILLNLKTKKGHPMAIVKS
jgi:hypothetical protein